MGKDLDKALINLNFDDGRIDTYSVAYPILKRFKLPATINITTGYVEMIYGDKIVVTRVPPMNVDMVKELALDSNIEIAGHGHWHKNTEEDIIAGIEHLKNLIPEQSRFGFASPGTGLNMSYYCKIKQKLKSYGLQYVRLSLRYNNLTQIKILCRKLARVTHIPFLYRYSYQDTLMSIVKDDIIYSVPILSSTHVSEIKSLIRYAVKRHKALILMFHSIVDDGQVRDNWDFEKSKFYKICQLLSMYRAEGILDVNKALEIHSLLNN